MKTTNHYYVTSGNSGAIDIYNHDDSSDTDTLELSFSDIDDVHGVCVAVAAYLNHLHVIPERE